MTAIYQRKSWLVRKHEAILWLWPHGWPKLCPCMLGIVGDRSLGCSWLHLCSWNGCIIKGWKAEKLLGIKHRDQGSSPKLERSEADGALEALGDMNSGFQCPMIWGFLNIQSSNMRQLNWRSVMICAWIWLPDPAICTYLHLARPGSRWSSCPKGRCCSRRSGAIGEREEAANYIWKSVSQTQRGSEVSWMKRPMRGAVRQSSETREGSLACCWHVGEQQSLTAWDTKKT